MIIDTGGTKYFTVAISLERYFIAICHPLSIHHRYFRDSSVMLYALFTSGVSLFIVVLAVFSYVYDAYLDSKSFHIYAAVVLHFFPFIAVLVLNFVIYLGVSYFHWNKNGYDLHVDLTIGKF
jgi:hypothetical protein